jgi:hypothetical protein
VQTFDRHPSQLRKNAKTLISEVDNQHMFLHVFVIITHYGPLDLNTTCDALSLQLRAGHAGSKLILFTNHL